MASDNQDSTPVPVGGIAVLIVLAAGIFLKHEYPFESARPTESKLKAEQAPYIQDVDARLWEDPFAAIARYQQEKGASGAGAGDSKAKGGGPRTRDAEHTVERLKEHLKSVHDVRLVGVMVWGGPYADDVESRRRTRYAVLAGLDASDYVPEDISKIGFFQTPKFGQDPGELVPFEFFENKDGGKVLLLWLAEERLGKDIAADLLGLRDLLLGPHSGPRKEDSPELVAIGPATSTILKSLIAEAQQGCGRAPGSAGWHSKIKGRLIEFYSPGSTAIPEDLVPASPCRYATGNADRVPGSRVSEEGLQQLFPKEIRMVRTISNDGEVLGALADELKLRRVSLGRPEDDSDRVLLVSEWDTDYGRGLPQRFIDAACGVKPGAPKDKDQQQCVGSGGRDPKWATRVSYMLGLDGGVASAAGTPESKSDQGKEGKDKDSKAAGPNERADGNSQYDYLRRLALAAGERAHEGGPRRRVKAVGVLGADLYDKLLVLQALRPEFPDALFFTTDLDARLLQPNQHEWTRNLLVGSGHGLRLKNALQGRAPPFRSTYQTATYLAVRLALDHKVGFEDKRGNLDKWLSKPYVYEVGRTDAFALQPSTESAPSSKSSRCKSLDDCADIRPPLPFTDTGYSQAILAAPAWIVAALGILLYYVWPIRRAADRTWTELREKGHVWILGAGLALLAGTLIAFLMVPYVFSDPQGEPFAWAEGISIWPSELVRLVALALSIWFTVLTLKAIELEPGKPNGSFFPAGDLRKETASARLYHWHKLYREPRDSVNAHELWREFRWLEQPAARFNRLWFPFFLYVLMSGSLFVVFGDLPAVPCRGDFACRVDYVVLRLSSFAFLILLFLVVDSIRLGTTLIRNLSTGRSVYPAETLAHMRASLNLPQEIENPICEVLDIRLIGAFTERLGRCLYLPFVVLALTVVARSRIFDNWRIPPALFLMFVFAFLVTVICAVVLQHAAERARGIAVGRMTEYLMQARGESCSKGSYAPQLEMMLDEMRNTRRGAFLPFLQQPLVRAFLVPAGGLGGVQLLEYSLTGMSF